MAERRMFAKTIVDSDAFLDMPATTQLLYFHLSMRADDDGFINRPKAIMRDCRSNDDDMKLLIAKKFIIPFESGVVVIKHWKIHNYIAKDRYTETKYKEEKSTLVLDENKAYTQCIHNCIQDVDESETQVRLGKYSKDKNSINNEQISKEFETLWKMYPNKKGKDKALSYYQKARKSGTTFEEVEQGIKNYCKEIQVKKTSTQYIKHGSTWFNNKGWLDNYDFTFDASANKSTSKFGYVPDDGSDLPY